VSNIKLMKKILFFALLAIFVSSPVLAARVGVVTTFPDGRTITTCVSVPKDATAKDALNITGMRTEWKIYPFGDALTRIEDVGCPESDPFCECKSMECCLFWNLWILKPGEKEWKFSPAGYSNYIVEDRDVIGNIWAGDATKSPPLKEFSQLESLCPKMKTFRSSKYYGMHMCESPTVDVIAPKNGSIFESRRVTVEADSSHTMKRITAIINNIKKILCTDCDLITKEITASIGNNKLQVQVEDYIGRKGISDLIEFLVKR